jgi:hypothetical protein
MRLTISQLWLPSRHNNDAIDQTARNKLSDDVDMAIMDGVKSPAIKPNYQWITTAYLSKRRTM